MSLTHRHHGIILEPLDEINDGLAEHIVTGGRLDCETEHYREGLSTLDHSCGGSLYGSFRILHIKDGLDEEHVHPTLYQCLGLFEIGIIQGVIIEGSPTGLNRFRGQ